MEHQHALRDFLVHYAHEIGLELTEEQSRQFLIYLEQMLQWNRVTNLTGITDSYEIVSKHFVDSLTALAALSFPSHAVVIDVGSGAGFPGLPLKIARSDLRLILIESIQKKCSFLRTIVGLLKLSEVSVFAGTLEEYIVQEEFQIADVIVVRALRFEEVEGQLVMALKKGGRVLLYRTDKWGASLSQSGLVLESERCFSLPLSHGNRVISVFRKSSDA